jgi:hypothetical protein
MAEWWHALAELIARQLARRWRALVREPRPPAPSKETEDARGSQAAEREPEGNQEEPGC